MSGPPIDIGGVHGFVTAGNPPPLRAFERPRLRAFLRVRSFEFIRQRAVELARTGQHIDCITIEMALEREGFSAAFEALRDSAFRAHLTGICAAHWGLSAPDAPSDLEDAEDGQAFDGVPFRLPFVRGSDSSDEA